LPIATPVVKVAVPPLKAGNDDDRRGGTAFFVKVLLTIAAYIQG
jgi:hypothetical protein